MNIKVSVIIPVYNVQDYLRECLDSILNQTLKELELICVDDGSTDKSLEILREYEKKDNRVIVLTQHNKGAGAARNKGLEIARGEYLSFLDSDDFFATGMLEESYRKCKKENAEVCVYQVVRYNDVTGKIRYDSGSFKKVMFQREKKFFLIKTCQNKFLTRFRTGLGISLLVMN